jgi:hypothetical protein
LIKTKQLWTKEKRSLHLEQLQLARLKIQIWYRKERKSLALMTLAWMIKYKKQNREDNNQTMDEIITGVTSKETIQILIAETVLIVITKDIRDDSFYNP